jgi:hypothetical protein
VRAGHLVGKYFAAPGFLQRINLRIQILAGTADSGIADSMKWRSRIGLHGAKSYHIVGLNAL